jgi:transketolase N-terminal domain/subunit
MQINISGSAGKLIAGAILTVCLFAYCTHKEDQRKEDRRRLIESKAEAEKAYQRALDNMGNSLE